LDANLTLNGSGAPVNNQPLVTTNGGVFTMKENSKITGADYNGQYAGGVYINSGTFNMEGGSITGNTSLNTVGGVYVNSAAAFNMSGGSIYGNKNSRYSQIDSDLYIFYTESRGAGKLNLSGNAQISSLMLHSIGDESKNRSSIILNGEFCGTVGSIDLMGNTALSDAKYFWIQTDSNVPIVVAAGVVLSSDVLVNFTLRDFVGSNAREAITGYHIYGTREGENNISRFGLLVKS